MRIDTTLTALRSQSSAIKMMAAIEGKTVRRLLQDFIDQRLATYPLAQRAVILAGVIRP